MDISFFFFFQLCGYAPRSFHRRGTRGVLLLRASMSLVHELSVVVVRRDECDMEELLLGMIIGECFGKVHHWVNLSLHWEGYEEDTKPRVRVMAQQQLMRS